MNIPVMPLFEFQLKNLKDVLPWGEEPELRLHWFGLTDGIYYLNVGSHQLFRFSDAILRCWSRKTDTMGMAQPYVDYQVVRLYEDLLEILPDVLEPVPVPVAALVETMSAQRRWNSGLNWYFEADDNDELDDLYSLATEWWQFRKLSTAHLNQGPDIWFWRINDTVRIRWDNKLKNIDGIQPWSAVSGQYDLTVANFLQEADSFHNRLLDEMEKRIDLLLKDNPIPDIKIDFQRLIKEHDERKDSLEAALKRGPQKVEWDQVLKSNEKLFKA